MLQDCSSLRLLALTRTSGAPPYQGGVLCGRRGGHRQSGTQFAPIIKLEEVAVTNGEEDKGVLLDMWVSV
jgi:hypothetical protein